MLVRGRHDDIYPVRKLPFPKTVEVKKQHQTGDTFAC